MINFSTLRISSPRGGPQSLACLHPCIFKSSQSVKTTTDLIQVLLARKNGAPSDPCQQTWPFNYNYTSTAKDIMRTSARTHTESKTEAIQKI